MDRTRGLLLLTIAGCVCGVYAGVIPEELPIDEVIRRASHNSKSAFDFFWDEKKHLALSEYDIVMPQKEWMIMHAPHRQRRTAGSINYRDNVFHWFSKTVNYEISSDFNEEEKATIKKAFNKWDEVTCLTFKENTNRDRIKVIKGDGCWSSIGMQTGVQELSLGDGCIEERIALHEIAHAIGVYHEQSRPDRDQFVTIHEENVKPGSLSNFDKKNAVATFNLPYDYTSIMHYSSHSHSKNDKATITAKDKNMTKVIGKATGLSELDIATVKKMYKCR